MELVSRLRGPDGCPWDKEQTHLSLTRYAVEETAELVEAIEGGDDRKIKEELGDVLFQVALHSQIASETGRFTLPDVMLGLVEKMVRRHPHVFGDIGSQSIDEVWKNWEKIKAAEKASAGASTKATEPKKLLDAPVHLPALQRAAKIGQRTKNLKFDWNTSNEVLAKVDEEISELKSALASGEAKEVEHELGDVLFSLAQLARHNGMDPEQVLRGANRRFENRFEKMHEICKSEGRSWDSTTPAEKESLWSRAKALLKGRE